MSAHSTGSVAQHSFKEAAMLSARGLSKGSDTDDSDDETQQARDSENDFVMPKVQLKQPQSSQAFTQKTEAVPEEAEEAELGGPGSDGSGSLADSGDTVPLDDRLIETPTPEKKKRAEKQADVDHSACSEAPVYAKVLAQTLKHIVRMQKESAELQQRHRDEMDLLQQEHRDERDQLLKQIQNVLQGELPSSDSEE